MACYAREERGYSGVLITELTSRSTWENVRNAIPFIEDADRIKFVSNSLHAEQGRVYLRQLRPDLADRLVPRPITGSASYADQTGPDRARPLASPAGRGQGSAPGPDRVVDVAAVAAAVIGTPVRLRQLVAEGEPADQVRIGDEPGRERHGVGQARPTSVSPVPASYPWLATSEPPNSLRYRATALVSGGPPRVAGAGPRRCR